MSQTAQKDAKKCGSEKPKEQPKESKGGCCGGHKPKGKCS